MPEFDSRLPITEQPYFGRTKPRLEPRRAPMGHPANHASNAMETRPEDIAEAIKGNVHPELFAEMLRVKRLLAQNEYANWASKRIVQLIIAVDENWRCDDCLSTPCIHSMTEAIDMVLKDAWVYGMLRTYGVAEQFVEVTVKEIRGVIKKRFFG